MKRILITHALKEETVSITVSNSIIDTLYTGVGKVKSAMTLTEAIFKTKPDLVLNIGTAGTASHKIGDIFVVTYFIDRDYEAAALPGIEFELSGAIGFDQQNLADVISSLGIHSAICSTGDTFVTEHTHLFADVVDMEAYAQAYVCKTYNVPFLSVKYVTDVIGENNVEKWQNKLADARADLTAWFQEKRLIEEILNL